MKTKCFAFLFMLCVITCFAYSQEPQWKWARTTSSATLLSAAADSLGNVVSIGIFNDPVMNFGTEVIDGSPFAGSSSMYIVKYNSAGGLLWAQSLYGISAGSEIVPAKVVANDNGMIAVMCKITGAIQLKMGRYTIPLKNTDEKLLILTISRAGRLLWFRMLEPVSMKLPRIDGTGLALDIFGNVCCSVNGIADTVFAGKDFITGEDPATFLFVSRFNSAGGLDWLKTCGFEPRVGYTQMNSRFLVLGADGIHIAGDYLGNRDYYFNSSILTGDTSLNAFVAKLSYSGDFLWAKSFKGEITDIMAGLSKDLYGNTYLTGVYNSNLLMADAYTLDNYSGAFNLFISKLEPDGRIAWLRDIDIQLVSCDIAGRNSFLRTDALGQITLVTNYMGATVLSSANVRPNANKGTRDLLAVRMDNKDGSIRWVRTGNSIADDWISSVTFDRFGSTYILGSVTNSLVFDSISFEDVSGNGGFYIIKIN